MDIEQAASEHGWSRLHIERFKQSLQYVPVESNLLAALNACRVADYVLFVLSATDEVDEFGETLLRTVESQGISTTLAVVQGLDKLEPAKKRPVVANVLKRYISHFLPSIDKVLSLDSAQECQNVIRSLCNTTPKSIHWREDRSWMLVEDVQWLEDAEKPGDSGTVVLTGVVRGKGLNADRLLHVDDWGAFQIDKIESAPLNTKRKSREGEMAIDTEGGGTIIGATTEDQEDLEELAPEEMVMEEVDDGRSVQPSEYRGVFLDEHRYFSDEETKVPESMPKRLPRGTSRYQAAWYLDGASDSGSDLESVDESFWAENGEDEDSSDEFNADASMKDPTEAGPSEYPQSEMFLDPAPEDEAAAIDAYRESRKDEEAEDLEFPDEIELHPNVLARERLARYRGLKSLKTSTWDAEEDRAHEPEEWRRLLEVKNYKGAKNRVLNESLVGGVKAGTRCSVHLRAVPLSLRQQHDPSQPLTAFSLLRHEHKRAAVNYSFSLSALETEPLRSKSEIVAQCGPRRFVINPLFSASGNTPNDVHKFHRFLHPGRTAIASVVAPLTWGAVPILYFEREAAAAGGGLRFIGTGTALPPAQNRVVAKRIVLTGHPFKIHKRLVTVRYMFFNSDDVAWFKALPLWTRRGRTGFIKESLGTHGYFKATFDGKINPMDAVAVSLYKRVWPRNARLWKPWEEAEDEVVAEDEPMDAPAPEANVE